jgi:aarF domain-containing kinase
VYVPNLFDDYTRKRVLVMEWIEGVKITEFERMARQKLNVSEAIKIVIEAFAE